MNRPTWLLATVAGLAAAAVLALTTSAQAQMPAPPDKPAALSERAAELAFKRADTNNDGKLSKEEVEHMPTVAAAFDEADKDKDGFLSLAEFLALVAPKN